MLTLQRAGIKELLVLAGDDEALLRRALHRDPRVTMLLRWMPVREFPPDDFRTWEALGHEIRASCLIVGGRTLFSRELIDRINARVREGETALVVREDVSAERSVDSANPAVRVEAGRALALCDRLVDDGGSGTTIVGVAADIIAVPGRLLRMASLARSVAAATPLKSLVEQAISEGTVQVIHACRGAADWFEEVRDSSSIRAAEQTLLRSRKGEFEGFVDTYFNRPVSRPLTRLFLKLGLSPNAVTVLSILIGLVSAVAFSLGTYASGVVGALVLQLSAILDCCDGEVARLTLSESEVGAQLDILGDNAVHMAIFAGVAWGLYQHDPGGVASWVPLALGGAAIFGTALSVVVVKRASRIQRLQEHRQAKDAALLTFVLKTFASRDFTVAVLILALLGTMGWFLWFAAIGSNVFWMVTAYLTRPSSPTSA